jgi:hypothetical protein
VGIFVPAQTKIAVKLIKMEKIFQLSASDVAHVAILDTNNQA